MILPYLPPAPQGGSEAETFLVQQGNYCSGEPSLSRSVCPQASPYRALEKGPRLLKGGEEKEENSSSEVSLSPFLLSPLAKKKRTVSASPKLINALDLLKEN